MFRLSGPFGEAILGIDHESAFRAADAPRRVRPLLPPGMRVDDCQLHTVSLQLSLGDFVTVDLRLRLLDGWVADYAGGEHLDAFEIARTDSCIAAVGMRDPDWFRDQFALVVVESSKAFGAYSKPVADLTSLTARYRASRAHQLTIQASVAWTNYPKTEQEAISPWFAVDNAMTF